MSRLLRALSHCLVWSLFGLLQMWKMQDLDVEACAAPGGQHPPRLFCSRMQTRCGTLPNGRWDRRVTAASRTHDLLLALCSIQPSHESPLHLVLYSLQRWHIHVFCNRIFSERLQSFCFISTVSIVWHFSAAPLMNRVIGISTLWINRIRKLNDSISTNVFSGPWYSCSFK